MWVITVPSTQVTAALAAAEHCALHPVCRRHPSRCRSISLKLLASGANAGDATGDVECMAQGTRTDQHTGRVDESAGVYLMENVCGLLLNRLVRTRMPSGVGAGG